MLNLPSITAAAPLLDQWMEFLGPFHPLLLHMPIGMFIGAILLEITRMLSRTDDLDRAVRGLLGWAFLFSVPTIVTGVSWWLDGGSRPALELHLWSSIAFGVLAFITWVLKRRQMALLTDGSYLAYLACLFLTAGILSFASHEGGEVVHGDPFDAPIPPPFDGIFGGDDPIPSESNTTTAVTNTVPVDASFFAVSVHPILDTYCIDCHGEEKQKGDIRLDSQEALGGVNENDDPILTVGNPEDSGLYSSMLLPDDDDYHMPPPKKPQPSAEEIELIKWWIESGADFEKTADELKLSDNPKAAPPSP